LKRAHNEYREQGNIEQTQKVEELMQQIAQNAGQQQPQVSQTATASQSSASTSNLIQILKRQTSNKPETPANPGDVPVSVKPQSTATSPRQ
jgi:hypothetical protein